MEALLERIGELPQWQIALAASWILLQACVLPSLPEEIVVTTLGMLVAQGRISPHLAFAAVLVGLLPANSAAAFIGSLGRSRIGRGGRLGRLLGSSKVTAAVVAIRRHGPGLVLVTRFIPFLRGPLYLATGPSGLLIRRFFALDALAAYVQVPLLLWIGSRLGRDATPQEGVSSPTPSGSALPRLPGFPGGERPCPSPCRPPSRRRWWRGRRTAPAAWPRT